MIDWTNVHDLLVNQKLEEIIAEWFGVDLFYVDEYGNIQSPITNKGHDFQSQFFKVLMGSDKGLELVKQDVDFALDKLSSEDEGIFRFESSFQGVKGFVAKIEMESQFFGAVFVYPFVKEGLTKEDESAIRKKFEEIGVEGKDVESAVEHLKVLDAEQLKYFKGLVKLVAEETAVFQEEISKREERIQDLNSELGSKYRFHSMIGKSKKMQQVYNLLSKVSKSDATILVQGENGTGKELVAKAIHYGSNRKDKVFLAQNCSAFNDNLLDSELFGHVKGAFTGAIKDKVGLFEAADGGSLFLDEIGDTSLSMQVKLLRVLQEGTFVPVGGTRPKKINVRVIAATNKPLKEMIAKGEFREDLYYRLNVINIALPALRERKEDIPLLVDHFLNQRCQEAGMPMKTLGKKAMEKLLDYNWPGNVRELENEMERLVVLAGEDKSIGSDLLSSRIIEEVTPKAPGGMSGFNLQGSLKEAMKKLEIIMIREGLKRCDFNKSKLAKELGISRAGLISKVDKYGLDKRNKAS